MTCIRSEVITRVIGPLANNGYAILDPESRQAAIVDPGFSVGILMRALPSDAVVSLILLTHGHFDHVAGVAKVKNATGSKVGIHRDDEFLLECGPSMAAQFGLKMEQQPPADFYLSDGDNISVGNVRLSIRHTPGHSPGGITIIFQDEWAMVGDTLFAGSIGRYDLPNSNYERLMHSIGTQLLTLPDKMRILPGHGPDSTIGQEKRLNPYLIEHFGFQ